MSALPELEEYCPNCGEWVNYLSFDYDAGWCRECAGTIDPRAKCIHCGNVLQGSDVYRTTCRTCRQELWLARYADELEYIMLVKGYSFAQAKAQITKMVRPICQACHKPIKGAQEGALFHKRNQNKACHSAYVKFKSFQRSGMSVPEALDKLRRDVLHLQ